MLPDPFNLTAALHRLTAALLTLSDPTITSFVQGAVPATAVPVTLATQMAAVEVQAQAQRAKATVASITACTARCCRLRSNAGSVRERAKTCAGHWTQSNLRSLCSHIAWRRLALRRLIETAQLREGVRLARGTTLGM
jgi:hypothetical protein